MSTPQRPEEFPPQAGGELPDLSLRNFGPQGWPLTSNGGEDDVDNNPGGAEQQSIFSKRSGIQDPLVRPEGKNPDANEPQSEARTEASTEVAAPQVPQSEDELTEQEQPEAPLPERKGRGTKQRPRLVKSKRHLDRARRRQKNYLQERRDKKRLRVFFHRIKMVLKLCFAVLWGVLLWEALHSNVWTFGQPSFALSETQLIRPEQISPWVKQQVGKPIYAIDTGNLARKIKQNFQIAERVVVRRQMFPNRLEILIQEKQPWAEIYTTDPNPPQDNKANPPEPKVASETLPIPKPKPVIRPYGLVVPSGIISLSPYHYTQSRYQPGTHGTASMEKLIVTPGTVFSLSYLDRLRELAWQARQIPGLHLQSVDVRNPNRIVFNYEELPVVLGRMNGNATERLARLSLLIPKINEYRDGMQFVDLQWEEQVTFHRKPNAKLDLPKPEPNQG
jgi:hypothetical protein